MTQEAPTAVAPASGSARDRRRRSEDPVFVDASGRRQRNIRRPGRLLALPAAGYVALLVSSALGGPTISSPFLPRPAEPHRTASLRVPVPTAAPNGGHGGAGSPSMHTPASTAAAVSAPTPTPTARPTPIPTSTSAPTPTTSLVPATTPPGKRRSTTASGNGHKPTKTG